MQICQVLSFFDLTHNTGKLGEMYCLNEMELMLGLMLAVRRSCFSKTLCERIGSHCDEFAVFPKTLGLGLSALC
jgi:hypothetical protein